MQVQAIRNYSYYTPQNKPNSTKKENSQSFGSILSDANSTNEQEYKYYTTTDPDFRELRGSSTRIFRELSTELAIAKLLNPNEKSQIKILGCADGSEVWGYAIGIKEAMGAKSGNVNIVGVDIAPYMIDMAKTGCLVISSTEKEYADGKMEVSFDESPIKGCGWNKYLTKTKRPERFYDILKKYPCTKYMEYNPATNKSIGHGLEWYKVNKNGLPKVRFECGDMRESLTPDENSDTQVYVIANSSAYILNENTQDFINIFRDIKKLNKNKKNVYVVIGEIEYTLLTETLQGELAESVIQSEGFRNVSSDLLESLGIKGNYEASAKIYKLTNKSLYL